MLQLQLILPVVPLLDGKGAVVVHVAAADEVGKGQHIGQASAHGAVGIQHPGKGTEKHIDGPDIQKHVPHADHAVPCLSHDQHIGAEGSDAADQMEKALQQADFFPILPQFILNPSGIRAFFPQQLLHMENTDIHGRFQRMDKARVIHAKPFRLFRFFHHLFRQLSGPRADPPSRDHHDRRSQDQKGDPLPGSKKIPVVMIHTREHEKEKDQGAQRIQAHFHDVVNIHEISADVRPLGLPDTPDPVQRFLFLIFFIVHPERFVRRPLPHRIPAAFRYHFQSVPAALCGQAADKGQPQQPEQLPDSIFQPSGQHSVQDPRVADHMDYGHGTGCGRAEQKNEINLPVLHLRHIQEPKHLFQKITEIHPGFLPPAVPVRHNIFSAPQTACCILRPGREAPHGSLPPAPCRLPGTGSCHRTAWRPAGEK